MVNEFNTLRSNAEGLLDGRIGGHTDANIRDFITSDLSINDKQLLAALIIQLFDRVESLESP